MKKLTAKQQAFVTNKVAGCTNRDAALAAGYSVAAASTTADKLMAMPAIRSAIKAASPSVATKPGAVPVMPRKHYPDAMSYLMDTMNHPQLPIALRMDAAKALLPYQHARLGEQGKKEKAKDRAHKLTTGKRGTFAPKQPPNLQIVSTITPVN